MARKRILRTLPPLADVIPSLPDSTSEGSRQLALLEAMRKAAKALRKKDSMPFYSMRQVASQFGLPLRTVALVYETLELEGILNRIRGSKTDLVGKTSSPRTPVRAIVGIPIWLHAMVVSPYSRVLHIEMEDRLRESGFVADFIFFRGEEGNEPDFAQRLLRHNLDKVIWHTPHPLASNVLLSLKDHGIQQIIIQSNESPTCIPVPTYLQDWQPSYREMAQVWRASGISRVVVPDPVYLPSKRAMKMFTATLAKHGLEVDVCESSASALQHKVSSHRKKANIGVAFMDQLGADAICNEEPVILEEIINSVRVCFCRGPIRMPYFNHRLAKADIIRFSPVEIADRVIQDLKHLQANDGVVHVFEASFNPQVSLSTETETL